MYFSHNNGVLHCCLHTLSAQPCERFSPEDQPLLQERRAQAEELRHAVEGLKARAALELTTALQAFPSAEAHLSALLARCFSAEKRRHEQLYEQTLSELRDIEAELDRYQSDKHCELSLAACTLLMHAADIDSVLTMRIGEDDVALANVVSNICARRRRSLSGLLATMSSEQHTLDSCLTSAQTALQSFDLHLAREAHSRLQAHQSRHPDAVSPALEALSAHIIACESERDSAITALLSADCESVASEIERWTGQSLEGAECRLGAFPFLLSVSKEAAAVCASIGDLVMHHEKPKYTLARELFTRAQTILAEFYSASALCQILTDKLKEVDVEEARMQVEEGERSKTYCEIADKLAAAKALLRDVRYSEAEACLSTVIDSCECISASEPLLTEAHACLAKVCLDSQRTSEVEYHLHAAMKTANRLDAGTHTVLIATIGCWLRDAGKAEEAEAMLRVAVEQFPAKEAAKGLTLSILAGVMSSQGRHEEAIATYNSALSILGSETSKEVARMHYDLARCYSATSDSLSALQHFQCCLAQLSALDPSSIYTAILNLEIGDWYLVHRLFSDCEQCYSVACLASTHFSYSDMAAICMKFVDLYNSNKQFADADISVTSALQYMRAVDAENLEVAMAILSQADIKENLCDFAKAKNYYEECLTMLPADHTSRILAYTGLARVSESLGELSAAARHWTSALSFISHHSSDSSLLIQCYAALGQVYEVLSQQEQAMQAYRAALDIQLVVGGSECMAVVLYRAVGLLYAKMNSSEAAELALTHAVEILKEQQGSVQAMTDIYKHLAVLYVAWNRLDKVETVIEEGCAAAPAFSHLPEVVSCIEALIDQFTRDGLSEKKQKWEKIRDSVVQS